MGFELTPQPSFITTQIVALSFALSPLWEAAGLVSSAGQNQFMTEFFNDVEIVKKNINFIKDATKRVSEINQQVVLATTNDREADVSASLGPTIADTNKRAQIAKTLLQRLREDTERMKSQTKKQSEIRIRENLVNTLTRKFVDVMKEYQSVQTKYKMDIKKKVKRQVQIVKPDATSEEIDAVLKSGNGADQVFKEAILKVSFRCRFPCRA